MIETNQESTESPVSTADGYAYVEEGARTVGESARLNRLPSQLFRYRVVKRFVDLALVVVATPIFLPVICIVGVLVVLSSPGPVFYSHRRLRRNGSFFSMWKFRTMCVNSAEVLDEYLAKHPEAQAEWSKSHKLRKDPRITPIGYVLRRYSIDELPQIWNVVNGTMSLVGPRPIVAAEVEKYGEHFSFYCRVNPGLTGLWQVSGRSTLSYDARVLLDRDYVEHWSLAGDIKILLRTFLSVANKDGAF